jgi:hypothetical protein
MFHGALWCLRTQEISLSKGISSERDAFRTPKLSAGVRLRCLADVKMVVSPFSSADRSSGPTHFQRGLEFKKEVLAKFARNYSFKLRSGISTSHFAHPEAQSGVQKGHNKVM